MPFEADNILSILDRCCDAFTFPMLDNGYMYLGATRLSLYRTAADRAMLIKITVAETHTGAGLSRMSDQSASILPFPQGGSRGAR